MTARRYPLDRFLQLTGWSLNQTQTIAACNAAEWRLRNEHGVTERIADRIACAAGWHPHEIWPEMLDHAIADLPDRVCVADDCDQRFVPANGKQRYCSRNCRSRWWQRRRYADDEAFRTAEIERRRRAYRQHHTYELARQRRYRMTHQTQGAA